MIRQRLRLRSSPARTLALVLALVAGIALCWYGLMAILLATGVEPDTVNAISGYRDVEDAATGVGTDDVDGGTTRLITGLAGLAAFVILGACFVLAFPRTRMARGDLAIRDGDTAGLSVEPRAPERIAEVAARDDRAVTDARARLDAQERRLEVDVALAASEQARPALAAAQLRVADALERHGLPRLQVDITMSKVDPERRKVR